MKVSYSEYKVISVRRYLIVISSIFFVVSISLFLLPLEQVWPVITSLSWIIIFIFSFTSILNAIKAINVSQYPAPNTYVLSNWNVHKGSKAITYGKVLLIQSIVIFAFSCAAVIYQLGALST